MSVRMSAGWFSVASMVCLAIALGGCMNEMPANSESNDALSQAQKEAVSSAAAAAAALAQATSSSQGTPASNNNEAQQIPDGVTVGTCPEITTSLNVGEAFDVTIDFSTGCEPLGSADYACSGSASGQLDFQAQTLDLTFNNLNCNDDSLTGTAALGFSNNVSEVVFIGDWDLTWTSDGDQVSTEGNGTCFYNFEDNEAEIQIFSGSITDATTTYGCDMETVKISYVNNASFIPSNGTITLEAGGVGTVAITFNENSPATGQVQVSFNGLPPLTVDLFQL